MKKIILAIGILPLLFVSCDKEEITRTIVATATIEGGADTKVSYAAVENALSVSWDNGDTFKASTTEGAGDITFTKTNGNNTFTTTSSILNSSTLYAYYAGTNVTRKSTTDKKGVTTNTTTINFSGQDGTIASLKNYELMTSSAVVNNDAVDFSFSHKCAILKVTVNASAATTSAIKLRFLCAQLNSTDITTANGITSGSIQVYKNGGKSETAKYVDFTSASISFPAGESTVYFVVPPISFTSALQYTPNQNNGGVITGTGTKTITLSSTKAIAAGNVYRVSITL